MPQKRNQILLLLCLGLRGHKNILSTFCPFPMTHQEDKALARELVQDTQCVMNNFFFFSASKVPSKGRDVPDSTALKHFTAIPV